MGRKIVIICSAFILAFLMIFFYSNFIDPSVREQDTYTEYSFGVQLNPDGSMTQVSENQVVKKVKTQENAENEYPLEHKFK